jgi:hypothetical protein
MYYEDTGNKIIDRGENRSYFCLRFKEWIIEIELGWIIRRYIKSKEIRCRIGDFIRESRSKGWRT